MLLIKFSILDSDNSKNSNLSGFGVLRKSLKCFLPIGIWFASWVPISVKYVLKLSAMSWGLLNMSPLYLKYSGSYFDCPFLVHETSVISCQVVFRSFFTVIELFIIVIFFSFVSTGVVNIVVSFESSNIWNCWFLRFFENSFCLVLQDTRRPGVILGECVKCDFDFGMTVT